MKETRETPVRSLGGEDRLEKEIATHSSILDWGIPWTEEPGGIQSIRSQRVWMRLSHRACKREATFRDHSLVCSFILMECFFQCFSVDLELTE